MKELPGEKKLELLISYILILGVSVSVILETAGIVGYYNVNRNLAISFSPEFALKGTNFFSYVLGAVGVFFGGGWTAAHVLAFGLVVLMITPYLRVVASVGYFGLARNLKYLLITLFVLVILTGSLLIH
jgi:uncharacterized membrane protein